MFVGKGQDVYNASIPRPARARPGDVLVICAFTDHSAAFPLVWPAGWNTLGPNIQLTSDSCNCNVGWKVYQASDPASYTITNGMTYGRAVCMAFRHVRPTPVWAVKKRSDNMVSPWINPMPSLTAPVWSDALTFVVSDPNLSTPNRVQELPGWLAAHRFQNGYFHATVGVRGAVRGSLGPHGGYGVFDTRISQSAAWTIAFPRIDMEMLSRLHGVPPFADELLPDGTVSNTDWTPSTGTAHDALSAVGGAYLTSAAIGARARVTLSP